MSARYMPYEILMNNWSGCYQLQQSACGLEDRLDFTDLEFLLLDDPRLQEVRYYGKCTWTRFMCNNEYHLIVTWDENGKPENWTIDFDGNGLARETGLYDMDENEVMRFDYARLQSIILTVSRSFRDHIILKTLIYGGLVRPNEKGRLEPICLAMKDVDVCKDTRQEMARRFIIETEQYDTREVDVMNLLIGAMSGSVYAMGELGWVHDPHNISSWMKDCDDVSQFWYECAAELGDPIAQNNLAVSCACSRAEARDCAKVRYWYAAAAMQGLPVAIKNFEDCTRCIGSSRPCDWSVDQMRRSIL